VEVYISRGNEKLGEIANISLSLDSCKEKETYTCDYCYIKSTYHSKFVYHIWHKNYLFYILEPDEFFESFEKKLNAISPGVFRYFVSGDFPDTYFIERVYDISRKFSDTKFFVYTRSWQKDEYLFHLKELNKLNNFTVFASLDRSTKHLIDRCDGLFKAYFINDDNEDVPEGADLVFRNYHLRETKLVRKNNVLVCPKENGIVKQVHFNCTACKWCFKTLKRSQNG
jgi:hypothetical protein